MKRNRVKVMRTILNNLRCLAGPRPPFAWPVAVPLWGVRLLVRLAVLYAPTRRNRELRRVYREWAARQRGV
jgi:hypothetical protein